MRAYIAMCVAGLAAMKWHRKDEINAYVHIYSNYTTPNTLSPRHRWSALRKHKVMFSRGREREMDRSVSERSHQHLSLEQ